MNMIEVENVTMKFRLANDKIQSLKEYIIAIMAKKLEYKELCVFRDLNFQIKQGEVVGIIGRNGAGKSTLLKIIAGVLTPTEGRVNNYGNIVPMLELGSGFDVELSGRENVFLNGSILGYSKKFLEEKYQEIVEFSELGDFIEEPIRNYSSGMLMRLAFSIATIVHPEILIVDEILAVGDEAFQRKSKRKMLELMGGGTTVLFVSHSIDQIREMCSRVIWIENGKIEKEGEPKAVCDMYQNFLNPDQNFFNDQNSSLRNTDAYKYLMDVLIIYNEDELSYYSALARKEQLLAGNVCSHELCLLDLNSSVLKQFRMFIFVNCEHSRVESYINTIKVMNKSFMVECNIESLINTWKMEEPLAYIYTDSNLIAENNALKELHYVPFAITEKVQQVSEWMRYDKNILPYKNLAEIEGEQELINYNRVVMEKKKHENDGVRIGFLVDSYHAGENMLLENTPYNVRTIVGENLENVIREISKVDYVVNMTTDRRWDQIMRILCKLVEVIYCGSTMKNDIIEAIVKEKGGNQLDYHMYKKELEKYSTLGSGVFFSRVIKDRMSKSITFVVKHINELEKHPSMLEKILDSVDSGLDTSIMTSSLKGGNFTYKDVEISTIDKTTKYVFGSFDTVVIMDSNEYPFIITYPNIQKRVYFVTEWEPGKYDFGDFAKIKSNQSYLPCIPVEFWTDTTGVQNWLKEKYGQDAQVLI